MRNLHSFLNIAVDVFENRKDELKGEDKDGNWFIPLKLHILSKLGCLLVSEITRNRAMQYVCPYLTIQKLK